jgi:hypothetical protein
MPFALAPVGPSADLPSTAWSASAYKN